MKITGNYTTQQYRNFPLDAEGLLAIQQNITAVELIGRLAGNKAIICGCELNESGTHRSAGWVWLKTALHPNGELLPWEGGIITAGMRVKSVAVEVQADGYTYPQAYTERVLTPGTGDENYSWGDFHEAESTEELRKVIDEQAIEISKIKPEPVGVVKMYAGQNAPDRCMFCDGRELQQSEYTALFEAIGIAFNNAPNSVGVPYTTAPGCFRLPDLRGRFIVGHNAGDTDYNKNGLAGGMKTVTLTAKQMAVHGHTVNDYGPVFNSPNFQSEVDLTINGENVHAGNTTASTSMQSTTAHGAATNRITVLKHNTGNTGGGESHENRPPWYALSYIITVK